ncbi:protease m50 membrane-bound transcription factor site 2 protease [Anaeramoeba flamelloides]|uniref:Endopeptidase S2P n=1 Tax=Anaeramoeba flamelloides TaxID=1746091 RepID=A0ABQ8Y4S0_9EUKA|nr:protease m50 membrane-bound transcription factor site 2 protease [Anaeramoeba flamelloides]
MILGFFQYLILWVAWYCFLRGLFHFFPSLIERLLTRFHLSISIFSITRSSGSLTSFCNYLLKLPTGLKRIINWWFSIGAFVTIFLIVFVFFFLTLSIIVGIRAILYQHPDPKLFNWIYLFYLPGSDVPQAFWYFYLLDILILSLIHEFGHALATISQDFPISKAGYYLAVIWPGFFVEINSIIRRIGFWDQLKICCAGIWQNFMVVVTIFLLLFSGSYIQPIFYNQAEGVVISKIKSPIFGETMSIGDCITQINNCSVNSTSDFYKCLDSIKIENEKMKKLHNEQILINEKKQQQEKFQEDRVYYDEHEEEEEGQEEKYKIDKQIIEIEKNSVKIHLDNGKKYRISGDSELLSKVIVLGDVIPKLNWTRKFSFFYRIPKFCSFLLTFSLTTTINILLITTIPGLLSEGETVIKILVDKYSPNSRFSNIFPKVLKILGGGLLFSRFFMAIYFTNKEIK